MRLARETSLRFKEGHFYDWLKKRPWNYLRREWEITKEAKTIETIDISLMRIFRLGPEVSLKGSPTVSPTTPALWAKEPLPPR